MKQMLRRARSSWAALQCKLLHRGSYLVLDDHDIYPPQRRCYDCGRIWNEPWNAALDHWKQSQRIEAAHQKYKVIFIDEGEGVTALFYAGTHLCYTNVFKLRKE